MVKEDRFIKKVKSLYTEITKAAVDPTFKFPEGGKSDRQISDFLRKFAVVCGGTINPFRVVDYCIFQIHKNRTSQYQRSLAPKTFGNTALEKYKEMSTKQKKYVEDQWLRENGITRESLYLKVGTPGEHPLAKYIYMVSEESTKRRCINTEVGAMICAMSTLMWSPFSAACQICQKADECKKETQSKFPEIYRLRIEEYDKGK